MSTPEGGVGSIAKQKLNQLEIVACDSSENHGVPSLHRVVDIGAVIGQPLQDLELVARLTAACYRVLQNERVNGCSAR